MSKHEGGASLHNFAPLYRRPSTVPLVSTNSLNISKTAFSSHYVYCGFCVIFMISSDCFPTNTNHCVSEMDNPIIKVLFIHQLLHW